MTETDAWPYDARQDDPLTALRIPVVGTLRPTYFYLVALCINEDPETPLWHGLRPNDHEAKLIQSFIEYKRAWYGEGYRARVLDARPLDIDTDINTCTLIKRGEGDWAYRYDTWTIGPYVVPNTFEGKEPAIDLPTLLDRINNYGAKGEDPNPRWTDWKAHHEVFGEPGRCGDPTCRTFEWYVGDYPGIDGAVLVCTAHGQPAPGWAYTTEAAN